LIGLSIVSIILLKQTGPVEFDFEMCVNNSFVLFDSVIY